MGLANCKECGKLYVQTSAGLCPECYKLEEEYEIKVARYLRDHARASITEVQEETGVPEKTILKMIKAGRVTGTAELAYPCETCGKPILEGRVCPECSRNVLGQLKPDAKQSAPYQPARRPGEGIHTTFNKR